MYLIGIDISKYKHDCFIATETGEIIKDTFSFTNNQQGFTEFHNVLQSLDPSQTKRIGLEATGHYGRNLKMFCDKHGYTYMEFNPFLVKKFSTSLTLRKTKTDKVDSRLLSMILLSVEYKVYPVKSYHIEDIKSLTRYYKTLTKKRSKEIVNLTNILDYIFPEFKPFFSNKFSKTALFILKAYQTTEKISNMNSKSHQKLNNLSRGKFSYARFIKLKLLAKETIGSSSSVLNTQLQSCLRVYSVLEHEIKNTTDTLLELSKTIDSPVFSIRGIGPVSALSIISEYGNFTSFNSPAAMLSFAGLEPSVIQSGTIEKTGKMVKRGSGYLRETIMNAAPFFYMYNPTIYDYYHKKRSEGKSHRVALTHVAKKMIRIIFHLVRNNESFDEEKLK
ncbi:MAG: IS110 family transposase [Candidatus Izemoplasmatales bacterium]